MKNEAIIGVCLLMASMAFASEANSYANNDGSLWAQSEGSLRWVGGLVDGYTISGAVPYFPTATYYTGQYSQAVAGKTYNNVGEEVHIPEWCMISGCTG